ncbi:MAG: M14 family zinc carboxypeptidase [Bacteroidota bacterium]
MLKKKLIVFLILTLSGSMVAQKIISKKMYEKYESYKIAQVDNKRFDHNFIMDQFQKLVKEKSIKVEQIGKSLQGRSINLFSVGNGDINILAWSQMHGDESTATMAILDILNFFTTDDELNDVRKLLLEKLTINFIPMLNPDGAEKFTRRNALQIDLNRDALRLQFPESQALKNVRDRINPQFGFNLHDQDQRYTAGNSYKSAALSFLAPAYNFEKDINPVRERTMKLIVKMYKELSEFIPGHIARYNDDFEPRAFGDNMVKWGTSSVLIESGGWKNNFEKQFIRKLNFISLMTAFYSIATENYSEETIQAYQAIPENDKLLFDLLLRNLTIEHNGKNYSIDVGINHKEKSSRNPRIDYYKSEIADIGDLSTFYGYSEYDCSGLTIHEGITEILDKAGIEEIKKLDFIEKYKQGIVAVKIINAKFENEFTEIPINIITRQKLNKGKIEIGETADFIIKNGNNVKYAVINGYLVDIEVNSISVRNALVD